MTGVSAGKRAGQMRRGIRPVRAHVGHRQGEIYVLCGSVIAANLLTIPGHHAACVRAAPGSLGGALRGQSCERSTRAARLGFRHRDALRPGRQSPWRPACDGSAARRTTKATRAGGRGADPEFPDSISKPPLRSLRRRFRLVKGVGLVGTYSKRQDLADQLRRVLDRLGRAHQEPVGDPELSVRTTAKADQPHRVVDRLGEQAVRELIEAFHAGTPTWRLAERYGISLSSVKRLLRRHLSANVRPE
jgi:hypothetical protein